MFSPHNHTSLLLKNDVLHRRRNLLKGLALLLTVGSVSLFARTGYAASEKHRILIVYFSHTGNTRAVARQIHSLVGGDLLELQTTQTYPTKHADTVRQAEQECEDNFRPQLSTRFPETMNEYDVIFVGYPVWAYTMPMALYSFFERYTFPGKTIVPFSTHMGSSLADGPEQIARLCPQARVLEGIAIRGNRAAESQEAVEHWLRQLGLADSPRKSEF